MSEFYAERRIKSHKPQVCLWCGEIVPAKTEATYLVSKDSDGFLAGSLHDECTAALHHPANEGWYPRQMQRGRYDIQ